MIDKVLSTLKEGLSLWKTHLEKKREIYEVSLDKKRDKALNISEEAFSLINNLFYHLLNKVLLNDEDHKYVNEFYKGFKKLEKKFNKYD